MARKKKTVPTQHSGQTLAALATSSDFVSDIKAALRIPESAKTQLRQVMHELVTNPEQPVEPDACARRLHISSANINDALSAMMAVIRTDEYLASKTRGLGTLARKLKLTPSQRKRLSSLFGALDRISGEIRTHSDYLDARKKLTTHLPTWKNVTARLLFAPEVRQVDSAETTVLPLYSLRFVVKSGDEEKEIIFQADEWDLARLEGAFNYLKTLIRRTADSVNAGKRIRALVPPSETASGGSTSRRKANVQKRS